MVQEKQLRELFKYIEANWDVCVEDVDKRDIKRIFGGVLCEDIMNDTLHEVKAEPIELKGNCSTFDGSRLVDQEYKPTEQVTDQVTDHEQPALNPIAEAFERGEKIRQKRWAKKDWVKKISETESIDEIGDICGNKYWDFKTKPEKWELYKEPTEKPSSQAKLDNSFDKDRFEAMFRAVVANSGHELDHKEAIELTEQALEKLDAYYATKEGGNNG